MLFTRLSVFAGRFDADAAVGVCSTAAAGAAVADIPATLERLVSQSLVQVVQDPTIGFVMLETIREFALERLRDRGAEQALRDGHLGYYMAPVETAEPQLRSDAYRIWLDRLDAAYSPWSVRPGCPFRRSR